MKKFQKLNSKKLSTKKVNAIFGGQNEPAQPKASHARPLTGI